MTTKTMGVRLNKDIQQRLEALGKIRDRSPHYLMKVAIERYLEDEEYLESEFQICKSRWEQYKLTGETIDHEEVGAWVKSLQQTEGVST